MNDPGGVLDAVSQAAQKIGPAVLGALLSLRWVPDDLSKVGRFISFVGGLAAAIYVGPLIAEITNATGPRQDAGIVFLTGLFSMMVAGEAMVAIRQVQMGVLVSDWLRKFFRIDR